MTLRPLSAVFCCFVLLVGACGDDDTTEADAPELSEEEFNPDDVGSDEGFCGHLSPDEIEDATGAGVDAVTVREDGCTWRLSESAAVIEGPNEGGDARLTGTVVDAAAFEAAQAAADEEIPVDDVADGALITREQQNGTETTLHVADGDDHFTLTLEFVLDGHNARATALTQLARLVAERN